MTAFMLLMSSVVFAVDIGGGIGISIGTEDFEPIVWMCGNRVLIDDWVEPGDNGASLSERTNNYAFEGESIAWDVVVFDKNGAEKISDVYATLGSSTQGAGNDIEANCQRVPYGTVNFARCNARIDEEAITVVDTDTMNEYVCTFTVESPDSMTGEYWLTVEAEDLDGLLGTMDDNEYWFLNPELELYISETALDFGDNVRPGVAAYSQTLLVGNNVESGSGVMMDMYIAGTDFYDPANSGAKCPRSNVLDLNPDSSKGGKNLWVPGNLYDIDGMPSGITYYATNGAYNSATLCPGVGTDTEGFTAIPYGDRIDQAWSIMDCSPYTGARDITMTPTASGNILAPGAEMAVTFRLALPEPCNGDFSSGDIFFWGEAV